MDDSQPVTDDAQSSHRDTGTNSDIHTDPHQRCPTRDRSAQ